KKRVSLYVMNHTSMLDGLVAVGALPHPFCGIENAAHLQLPGYGWLMRMANAIPVRRRSEGGQTGQLTKTAIERAGRGISVLAFPEAHRTPDGQVRDFRTGVFRMARDAGLPVVPVAIRGAHEVFPKGRWYVTPGHLDVYIGPTIETENLSDEELEVLSQQCRLIITDYLDEQTTVSPLPEAVTAPVLSA
ncbi:MAG: 1-acyl-sn-glycerol-3-phosphate acyltransferase, partial [Myxococcota bacterium]